jgi:hypothetical protein
MQQANPAGAAKSLTSLVFERIRPDILMARLRPNEKLGI